MAIRKVHRTSTNSVVEYYGPFWKLVSLSERKVIIHTALREGGMLWMVGYIPKRFTNYAYSLGYRVTDQWKKFKRRMIGGGYAAVPMIGVTAPGGSTAVVRTGNKIFKGKSRNAEKLAVAVERGANVKVRGTSEGGDIHIAIPYGHPLNPNTADAMRKLPQSETDAVVTEVAKQMAALVNTAQPVPGSRKGRLTIKGASTGIRSRVVGLGG